ncbi:hypothetical protein Ahy_A03g012240 isoform A [Arachis hypogaea]|uniref:Uncharacterized protein n=1 Tax=Arachis hypogaea TaxID=3818 RepID=A0A445DSV2_ARAHY|nr:hypothetical protein Ahy_A03g012240 isoform A [Arachis hypogaea]
MQTLDLAAMHALEFSEYANMGDGNVVAEDGDVSVGMEFGFRESTFYSKYKGYGAGCDWLIQASLIQKKSCWEIRRYNGKHTCTMGTISQDHAKLDSDTIVDAIRPLVEAHPLIKILQAIGVGDGTHLYRKYKGLEENGEGGDGVKSFAATMMTSAGEIDVGEEYKTASLKGLEENLVRRGQPIDPNPAPKPGSQPGPNPAPNPIPNPNLSFPFETTNPNALFHLRNYSPVSEELLPSPFAFAFATDGNHFFFILLIFVPFFYFLFFFESLWISLFTFKLQQTWSTASSSLFFSSKPSQPRFRRRWLPLTFASSFSRRLRSRSSPFKFARRSLFAFTRRSPFAFTRRSPFGFAFVWKPRCPASNSATNPCAPPSHRTALFCRHLLLAVCLGGAVSLTFIVWIQIHKGWDWGFGIGTIAMLLGIIIFAAALPLYRIHPAKGTSALLEIVQVYVAAIRNRRLTLPEDPAELYAIEQDREATLETEFLPQRDIYSDIGVTFDDIGALENVKDTLKELVMLPLQTMLAKETKGEKIEDGVGSSCSSIYLCGSPSSNGCYCHVPLTKLEQNGEVGRADGIESFAATTMTVVGEIDVSVGMQNSVTNRVGGESSAAVRGGSVKRFAVTTITLVGEIDAH